MKIELRIKEAIKPTVEELGFEIEYIEFVKELQSDILRVVIDKLDSNISIDDCETVSRRIEDIIDNLVTKEYILEVSSPGVERQLKNMDLYKKYLGHNIFVKLYKKINDKKEYEGILFAIKEESNEIVIKINEVEATIKLDDISSAHTVYNFGLELGKNKSQNLNQIKKF